MAIDDKVAALNEALQTLSMRIREATAAVRDTAYRALRSDKLDGYTLAQIRSQMNAPTTAHAAQRDNPHQVTAADLGIPTRDIALAEIDKLIPGGVFPISRYGNQTYLPVPVSGGIEAVRFSDMPGMGCPGMIENEGTYVFIYPGQDGGTQGVYYGLIDGVGRGDTAGVVNKTIRRYRPSFIPDGHYVSVVQRREGDIIMGVVSDSATHAARYLFFSICNNTMEDEFHTGCLIPYGGDFNYTSTQHRWNYILLEDGIWMFKRLSELSLRTAAEWAIWRIPYTQIQSGEAVTPERIVGWNSVGFHESFEDLDRVRMATCITSWQESDNPYILLANRGSTYNMMHSSRETMIGEKNRVVRLRIYGTRYAIGSDGVSRSGTTTFSFTIDLDNRRAEIDDFYKGRYTYNLEEDPASSVPIHAGFNLIPGLTDQEPHSPDTRCRVSNITLTSTAFTHGIWVRRTARNYFDILEGRYQNTDFSSAVSKSASLVYPTPLGTRFMGAINLPNGRILVGSTGSNIHDRQFTGMAYCRFLGLPDRLIASIYGDSAGVQYMGYAQGSERWFLADRGYRETDYLYPVTHVDSDGIRNYGTAFFSCTSSYFKTTAPHTFDQNLVTQGQRTAAANVLRSAMLDLIAAAYPEHVGQVDAAFVGLVVPQETNALPIMAIHWIWEGASYNALCNADVVWTGTAITAISIVPDGIFKARYTGSARGLITSHQSTTGQNVFYDTGDDILMGGVWPGGESHVGDSSRGTFRLRIDRNTGKIILGTVRTVWTTPSYQQMDYVALPDFGLGIAITSPVRSDDWARYTVHFLGKTAAEFDRYASESKASIESLSISQIERTQVLLTLRPASDFVVYFTEPVDVFMAGNYYLLSDATIDLTSLLSDPANTTFYVYVQLLAGVPQYTVSLIELADSETTMFIGTIVTDDNTISELNLVKVDRIGPYRLSSRAVGSAIPVTTGHPSDEETLPWW